MFQTYNFSKKDFERIAEGLKIINSKKMRHIFSCKVTSIDILSFDSKFIYIWSKRNYKQKRFKNSVKNFKIYRLQHNFFLSQDDYKKNIYLSGGIIEGKIEKKAPREINIVIPPFGAWDQLTRNKSNPLSYLTEYKEAYYSAIIAHEFAHWYFLQDLRRSQKNFLNVLQKLIKISKRQKKGFSGKEINNRELKFLLNPPSIDFLGELYAFLVGLEVIKIFYPKFLKKTLKTMTNYPAKILAKKPLEIKESLLFLDSHFYAHALASYLFQLLPDWVKIFKYNRFRIIVVYGNYEKEKLNINSK